MGWLLLLGSIVGCLAVGLSILWHYLDKSLNEIEPVAGEDFEETDARWNARRRIRDVVRVLGLACLYVGLVAILIGAMGLGISAIGGK